MYHLKCLMGKMEILLLLSVILLIVSVAGALVEFVNKIYVIYYTLWCCGDLMLAS